MTPQGIPLYCSLPANKKDELITAGAFTTKRDGMPFTNDDPLSDPRDTAITAITAKCYSFDLQKDEDRLEYSGILSRIQAGLDAELLWEERVKRDDGGLIVYLTILEYSQITAKTMERLRI